jgi:hypothetical protein
MADALHPQTFLAYGMNGGELSVGNGGPLRMRLPRQLGYKSVKYVTRLTVTDSLKGFGKGLGSAAPEGGYAWYAGIWQARFSSAKSAALPAPPLFPDVPYHWLMASEEDLKAEIERLRAENESLKKPARGQISLKVSEKGGLSVYGLGLFPVTLYREQWEKLLGLADDIRSFIGDNDAALKKKEWLLRNRARRPASFAPGDEKLRNVALPFFALHSYGGWR